MTFGEVRFLLLDYKHTLVVLIRQGQLSRDASTWLKRNVTPGDLLFTTLEFFLFDNIGGTCLYTSPIVLTG